MSSLAEQEKRDVLSDKDLYEQGSKCCQQYSQLTMQIRTLAQYIMIAYTVGISLTLTRSTPPVHNFKWILVGAGIVVCLFAMVLALLNYHYSEAFRAIRDSCLVRLEDRAYPRNTEPPSQESALLGPWQAHQRVRSKQLKWQWAFWHSPFGVLLLLGLAGIVVGMVKG